MTPNVLIATPTHRGEVTIEFMHSVVRLISELSQGAIGSDFVFRVGTDIVVQRNWLATYFWADDRFTHLLFIDDDMLFAPSAALKLIRSGYDVCGCVCPERYLDIERYHSARLMHEDVNFSRNIAQRYVGIGKIGMETINGKELYVRRGSFTPMHSIGCGVTLISRKAIATMLERVPKINTPNSIKYYNNITNRKEIIRFFDPLSDGDGTYLSEDVSFCRRWVEMCKGLVWGCVDEEIGHIGRSIYRGKFSDQMQHGPM